MGKGVLPPNFGGGRIVLPHHHTPYTPNTMISSLTWVPRGSMARIPQSHDPTPDEVDIARANAAQEAREEAAAAALAADPALASLAGVQLPPGFFDDNMKEDGGGRVRTVREGGAPGAFGRKGQKDDNQPQEPEEEEEEEEEDDDDEGLEEEDMADMEAHPMDAFVVVAATAEDYSSLEVYVYNEEDGSLYVRHDVTLPSFPVCLAWLDYAGDEAGRLLLGSGAVQPSQEGESYIGSFCAVGTFDPAIEIWNLDVVDPLEPTLVLKGGGKRSSTGGGGGGGKKGFHAGGSKKAAGAAVSSSTAGASASASASLGGHTDSVLGLSWNKVHRHLLASASADGSVKIWDIDGGGRVLHTLGHHAPAKAHSCAWNPSEPSILAIASYDRTLSIIDARAPEGSGGGGGSNAGPRIARYALPADPECLAWYPHNPAVIMASCGDGSALAYDARNPAQPLWSWQAHAPGTACTAIAGSAGVRGLLATSSVDRTVKLWDAEGGGGGGGGVGNSSSSGPATAAGTTTPTLLSTKSMSIGKIFTTSFFQGGSGELLAAGGNKGVLALWNIGEDGGDVTAAVIESGGSAGAGGGGEQQQQGSLISQYFAGRRVDVSSVPGGAARVRIDGQPASGSSSSSGGGRRVGGGGGSGGSSGGGGSKMTWKKGKK